MQYVGFWKRVLALLIDSIIVNIGIVVIAFAVGLISGILGAVGAGLELVGGIIGALGYLFYETLFVSSSAMATPGKMVIGAVVCKPDGRPLSMMNALGRCLGKYLSSFILCIGYLMVAFTKNKRGLHDMLAETVVVKKGSLQVAQPQAPVSNDSPMAAPVTTPEVQSQSLRDDNAQ
ncbi:MAG: hypothetical protein CMM93_01895 [Rickettsiales bacterium]|nr:hypothetical protein [Rickettsiales bacterium]|tara:strand:+ start:1058 stop:1585 length:528 start_codon:yes stop_codon:yes gene_type:complete